MFKMFESKALMVITSAELYWEGLVPRRQNDVFLNCRLLFEIFSECINFVRTKIIERKTIAKAKEMRNITSVSSFY